MSAVLVTLCSMILVGQGQIPKPPVQGQPKAFTGAIGSFRAELAVSSDIVEVNQPFTLTIRIVAQPGRTTHRAPGRPNLSLYKEYVDQFTIEDPEPTQRQIDERTWEFYYQLEALSDEITEVPAFQFFYYDPVIKPDEYKRPYSKPVPLTVLPKKRDTEPLVAPLADGPESLFNVVPAERTTRNYAATIVPPVWLVIVLTAMPPLGCLVWYWVWRQLNPNAARQAGVRRGRAAREALHSVERCKSVERLEQVLTQFLRQRFDLPIAAPTPLEAMSHLMRVGVSLEAVQQTGNAYRAIAAARFSPATPNAALDADVRQLIVTLENDPCRALLSC